MSTVTYLPTPPRVWSRMNTQSGCEGQLTQRQNKALVLQQTQTADFIPAAMKYARLVQGFGPSRKRCFSTQSETYTDPNTNHLRLNGANDGLLANNPAPAVVCTPTSASGVPGRIEVLCWDRRRPLTLPRPFVRSVGTGGSKWPVGYKFRQSSSAIHPATGAAATCRYGFYRT